MGRVYPLSDTQRDLLHEIRKFIATNGYSPSVRDLMDACRISSTSVVVYNVDRLVERGLVLRDRHVGRSIRLAPGAAKREA